MVVAQNNESGTKDNLNNICTIGKWHVHPLMSMGPSLFWLNRKLLCSIPKYTNLEATFE
jgi:hypothetical protein